jgi:hypothetical protein
MVEAAGGLIMPETLFELTGQLEQLRKARVSGVSAITYMANGISRSMTYKSDKELDAAIQDLERRIAGGGNRTIRVAASKGLENGE